MSVDIVGPFPKVRDLSSGKDVVKYAMVATALVPDYITKTGEKMKIDRKHNKIKLSPRTS